METENYLQMMIDSMQKKKVILKQIIVFNEEQEALLKEEDFNGAAFQKNMEMLLIIWLGMLLWPWAATMTSNSGQALARSVTPEP